MEEETAGRRETNLIDEWQQACRRRYERGEEKLEICSESGIPLKPVYTCEDIQGMSDDELGMPGVYPYTRGADPLGFRFEPIKEFMFFGFGLPEDTRKRMDMFLNTPGGGQMIIAVDMPTYYGYDPDHPISRGRVGQCGTSVCNVEDLEKLFEGVSLDKVRIGINTPFAGAPMLALYLVYAETRGYEPDQLRGDTGNRMGKAMWGFHPCFPAEKSVKIIVEVSRFVLSNMPGWSSLRLDGYTSREQGGNAIQELAFLLAFSICVTERVVEAGLSADNFLSRMGVKLNGGIDFFEEIAKFRAFRKLWAKINREKFDCKDPKALCLDAIVQTGGVTLTAQQPLNNIVRVTVETLAAVLGGIRFVDPCTYDEALSIPSEQGETIALRTGQILFHEANVRNVADPLAGSYYVEHLTRSIEEGVYNVLNEIEKRGGAIKCWEDGWFRQQIEAEAYKWKTMVDKKEKIVVGVNEYVMENEVEVPLFQVDPSVEEVMVKRLRAYKNKRDSNKLDKSLKRLRDIAPLDGQLMPGLIEAAKAGATLGEMMDVLRGVYGWRVYK